MYVWQRQTPLADGATRAIHAIGKLLAATLAAATRQGKGVAAHCLCWYHDLADLHTFCPAGRSVPGEGEWGAWWERGIEGDADG
jgi:hypothetical protein